MINTAVRLKIEEKVGYPVDRETDEIKAPCGCSACDDGVQQGHFTCEESPSILVAGEKEGMFIRTYDDGAWRWYVAARR